MPTPTRPYLMKFQGKPHLVQAISKEQAVSLVVAPHVTDVHAATAAEVMTFYQQAEKTVTSANEGAGSGKSSEGIEDAEADADADIDIDASADADGMKTAALVDHQV